MIVSGGATLTQRVADGSVAQALSQKRYKALVLQERGGDLICSFGPDSCVQSRQAINTLAGLARQKGIVVVLLGTYQPIPELSQHLVHEEASGAAAAGIPYIEVSEKLRRLRDAAPELEWLAKDGMHPGKDLALLNAMLVHELLRGSLPGPGSFTVEAPIYGINSGLKATPRPSDASPPLPDTPRRVHYSSDTVRKLLAVISGADGS